MEVKIFWRQADMFKNGKGTAGNLSNMGKALANIKQKDPPYDVSAMEIELKNRKLPTAVFKDANIEKQFTDAVNFSLAPSGKGTVTKVHILTDWVISRNGVTNVIVGRSRRIAVVVKGTDGKCYLSLGVFLQQEYVGGIFQNPSAIDYRLEESGEMLCGNVN